VALRFSLLSGARCRNSHSDHHHLKAGVALASATEQAPALVFSDINVSGMGTSRVIRGRLAQLSGQSPRQSSNQGGFGLWLIATFRCVAEFGRYRRILLI
jgi:hypothetical protein